VDKKRRQELQEQYANRKQPTGVFAVRNSASGEVWVGHSRNIDVQKNGLWGRLSSGMCFNRDVQDSWKEHGEAVFSYEILEMIEETDPHAIQRLLPEKAQVWRDKLKAGTVKGT
jgi:hypothetical protein